MYLAKKLLANLCLYELFESVEIYTCNVFPSLLASDIDLDIAMTPIIQTLSMLQNILCLQDQNNHSLRAYTKLNMLYKYNMLYLTVETEL